MPINLEKEILRGQDIKLEITCYDWDGTTLIDPSTNSVQLYKPDGSGSYTLHTNVTTGFTKVSDGVHRLIWTVPTDATLGWWKAVWTAVKTSYTSKEDSTFEVIDPTSRKAVLGT